MSVRENSGRNLKKRCNIQLRRDEINCHKKCRSAAFDREMTRVKENQECEWEKNQECVPSNISLKKSFLQFIAAKMKLVSDELIR